MKMPDELNSPGTIVLGDVLLSRGLSPDYHRGCSVSLPCSEWERVVPLRYDHQKFAAEPFGANFWWRRCAPRDLVISE